MRAESMLVIFRATVFGNAQAGAAAGHQRRAIFQAGHMPEDALDFLRAEW